MKIYTKTGDKGLTSLIGGRKVPKNDIRIEAYGSIDELIAYIGLLRDQEIDRKNSTFLIWVQDRLMTCASILATDCEDCKIKLPSISDSDITNIEKEIDSLNSDLPELSSFLLPGGHSTVSICHITRTVCRRAERKVVEVAEKMIVPSQVLQYLNRLSDYLFVLSRSLSIDLQIDEIKWLPDID